MRLPRWLIDPDMDEYFSRVDDEIRAAGEPRADFRFALGIAILFGLGVLVVACTIFGG